MKLHENKALFKDAVDATAQYKNLREIYVEKDYWVTVALHTIFSNEIGSHVVFKGGTALSKCFQIIERFSEDIDMVVLRHSGESDNQLTNKIKKIGKVVEPILPEVLLEDLTHKKGMIRKTAHHYDKIYDGYFGQIRDKIILEATWLGHFEPYTTAYMQSYIAEMMQSQNQLDFIQTYHLEPFSVRVLTKERTLCEKIMSLVRFSFTENPIFDLNKKIRHIYDIHKLLQDIETKRFFNEPTFEELLLKVANDDVKSFKNNNHWLSNHPAKAIIFSDITNTWDKLKKTYHTDFKDLVLGVLPAEKEILSTLSLLSERIKPLHWAIDK